MIEIKINCKQRCRKHFHLLRGALKRTLYPQWHNEKKKNLFGQAMLLSDRHFHLNRRQLTADRKTDCTSNEKCIHKRQTEQVSANHPTYLK